MAQRRPLDDESERLQPVFHAMDPATAGPRYGSGGCRTTVWKTRGNAPARAIRYPDLRARNPAPGFMIMRAEQGVAGYAPQVARPQNADVSRRRIMEIRISHVFFLAIALGVAALWYFGRNRPIEMRTKSSTEERVASCAACNGSGTVDCPRCGRFGSVEAWATCPTCKGTGKHQWRFRDRPDAPCQKCRGTGRIETRTQCTHCSGKGKVQCSSCNGTGKSNTHSTTSWKSVSMGYSLWERFLLLLRLSVDANPAPQRDSKGAYPMVAEYVRMKSAQRPCRITDWGEFKQRGPEWVMPATVEFTMGHGTSAVRVIEFIVQNRELKTTRTIQ